MSRLVIEGAAHAYSTAPVLTGVSLIVEAGETLCLLGPSGCGKSTLLRLCAGLERLSVGRIAIDDRLVAGPGLHIAPERRGVGMVFQDFALFPHLSVAANVGFGLAGGDGSVVDALLARVGMADFAKTYPHTLSGGQQQRVALARALARNPRLLLLDEPFAGLDARLRGSLREETRQLLKSAGVATLLVTHDPEEAMFMADRIALMDGGSIVQIGTPDALYLRPINAFVAGFFSDLNLIPGIARDRTVPTVFGPLPAPGLADGAAAAVLIRPEAILVESDGVAALTLSVRPLGATAQVVFDVAGTPLCARIPLSRVPTEGALARLALDPSQTFVFLAE